MVRSGSLALPFQPVNVGDDSRMTLQDLPPSLSIIAERHLARARTALEELGIDTSGMAPDQIFDRLQAAPARARGVDDGEAADADGKRSNRRASARIAPRSHRARRWDWRRRSRPRAKVAEGGPTGD